jgi:hypothetical protein
MMLREILSDKTGNLSSKRIIGTLVVIAAVVLIVLDRGDPASVQTLVWAGVASLGVGTLETKVNK